jgi:hypothetical protein
VGKNAGFGVYIAMGTSGGCFLQRPQSKEAPAKRSSGRGSLLGCIELFTVIPDYWPPGVYDLAAFSTGRRSSHGSNIRKSMLRREYDET